MNAPIATRNLSCKLENIRIPIGVTYIDDSTFSNCTSLTSIEIPATVTGISSSAFNYCTALSTVIFMGDAPESIDDTAFRSVTAQCYYPADNDTWTESVMQNYSGTLTWIEKEGEAEGSCGSEGANVTWKLYDDGVLSLNGTGAIENY